MQSSTSGSLPRQGSLKKDKKDEKLMDKLSTLGRRKKKEEEAEGITVEGRVAIDTPGIAAPTAVIPTESELEEGEERTVVTQESLEDPKVHEIIKLLINWINDELTDQRIIVKDIQEDVYDGLVIQKLIERLTGYKIEVPEVSQSAEGQRQKLHVVLQVANQVLSQPNYEQTHWSAESVHGKQLAPILHLLVALALHCRAPIRFPDNCKLQLLHLHKRNGQLDSRYSTEELTTTQVEFGVRGERDAFDTIFEYGPEQRGKVMRALITFSNKHLNKINLEVSDLETQFQDGVFLILLMGLLEGYFVPLHAFHLQVSSFEQKVQNVSFALELMQDAGLPKPRARPEDIVNGDLKCTFRVLHMLFTKYKHVS